MNLTNFLKQTDTLTAQYSADQLRSFIRDIGRRMPEYDREDFLKRLKAVGEKTEKESTKDEGNHPEFQEMYQSVRNNLKRIDSQEISVSGEWVGGYNDWEDDEEFYCQDEYGISDMLAEACDFVHQCMDMERYQEGYKVGDQLFSMEILCTNDECGDEEFSLGDMVHHELLDCDLKKVCLDTAYCAYCAMPLSKRAEALYGVIVNAHESEVTLEAVMRHGDEELSDFQDFLPLWITNLGTKTGKEADRFILEAVGLLNDVSAAEGYAKKYVVAHPGLYLSILENGKYAGADYMAAVGMRAVKIIPKRYKIRSRVALKTAEYIMEANETPALSEACYFAAYESDTCALNYLRTLLNGYGTVEKREELQKILVPLYENERTVSYDVYGMDYVYPEREENRPDGNMILLLRFLDGQFEHVLVKGLNTSGALGWSGTFMKQGIALFLLYLYEGEWTGKGIAAMAGQVKFAMRFSEEEYKKGTCERNATNEDDLFYNLFLKWKSMMQMDADIRLRAVKKIEGLLEKRTEGIMNANRRNYYGECAAYIAALGEVRESLGQSGAKQELMTIYKDKYSRRSAFRAELREYGWIDWRR